MTPLASHKGIWSKKGKTEILSSYWLSISQLDYLFLSMPPLAAHKGIWSKKLRSCLHMTTLNPSSLIPKYGRCQQTGAQSITWPVIDGRQAKFGEYSNIITTFIVFFYWSIHFSLLVIGHLQLANRGGRVVRWCWLNFQCRGVLQFGLQ